MRAESGPERLGRGREVNYAHNATRDASEGRRAYCATGAAVHRTGRTREHQPPATTLETGDALYHTCENYPWRRRPGPGTGPRQQ